MSDLDNQGCGLSTILGGIIFFVVLYLLRACHNFLNCLVFSWLLYYEMDSFFLIIGFGIGLFLLVGMGLMWLLYSYFD